MWMTRVSVDNPILATMVMAALAVLGLFSWQRLAVEEFPDVRFPIAVVSTGYPGASPVVVESEVTRPIEEAVNTISGVKHIRSYSFEGNSTVVVEFDLATDPTVAVQDVRDRVATVTGRLRREVDPPTVSRANPNDDPVMTLALASSTLTPVALSTLADQQVKKRLMQVGGVGEVKLVGLSRREVRIDLDPVRLQALGLAASDVVEALNRDNLDTPAGRVRASGQDISLRVDNRLGNISDFNSLVVASRAGRSILLADVATVRDGAEERSSLALVNGTPALAIEITAARGANVVATAEAVKAALALMQAALPAGTRVTVLRNTAEQVRLSLANVRATLFEGALLTVLIVWLFLGSWRSTVITGLTLPIALIGTLFALKLAGFTLNVMTLLALSLSIGLLIDDAIVVRENIVRHANMGKSHRQAALDGTHEIGLAVLATTLTVVAVFLPIGFMGGIIGQFFQQFGLTVVVAVLISLFVSFTLDPMLSSVWPDPHRHGDRHKGGVFGRVLDAFERSLDHVTTAYTRLIRWVLAHRKTTLALALGLLLASFALVPVIGAEFMPRTDAGRVAIKLRTAPGSTFDYTAGKTRAVEAALRQLPEVRDVYTNIAGSFAEGRNQATLRVYLSPKAERSRSIFALMPLMRRHVESIGGVQLDSISAEGGPGGGGKPVRIGIRGSDFATLEPLATRLAGQLGRLPGLTDVETSVQDRTPAYNVALDREAAAGLGINLTRLADTFAVLFAGKVASTWEAPDGENYDVRLQIPEDARTADLLDQLTIAGNRNEAGSAAMTPLSAISRIESGTTPQRVERYDQSREVSLTANLTGSDSRAVFAEIQKILDATPLPPGYAFDFGGEKQDMAESFGYAVQALAIGVIFIYMILAAQFRSFLQPLAIMVSLPLAFIGVFVALLLWHSTLNLFSVIGIIMLMGLAAKNGILLIDFINHARAAGMDKAAAIVEAGQVRLRPILMTSFAMIFGMLPLALALGEGSEARAPMAHAIIGGLVTSTLLTLVVAPVVYWYLDALGEWTMRRLRRTHGGNTV